MNQTCKHVFHSMTYKSPRQRFETNIWWITLWIPISLIGANEDSFTTFKNLETLKTTSMISKKFVIIPVTILCRSLELVMQIGVKLCTYKVENRFPSINNWSHPVIQQRWLLSRQCFVSGTSFRSTETWNSQKSSDICRSLFHTNANASANLHLNNSFYQHQLPRQSASSCHPWKENHFIIVCYAPA
jgi:hypothetical protein